jgi:hypothetical protein
VRAFWLAVMLGAVAAPTSAQSLEVFGYAGVLGEWELTATVTEDASRRTKDFSGPLTMTHVGLCTQDGPEKKTGQIHLQLSSSPSRLNASILVAGVVCSFSGRLSDFYTGMMTCPDREAVPLKLWVK